MDASEFTVDSISDWFSAKRLALAKPSSCFQIQECIEEAIPAVLADFEGVDSLGQITGWVTGRFYFQVVRVSDGQEPFSRNHVAVSRLEELDSSYRDFAVNLQLMQ